MGIKTAHQHAFREILPPHHAFHVAPPHPQPGDPHEPEPDFLTFSSADETALDEALATLERIFAPFITLTPAQARALLKMGDKSEPFCRQTVMVLEQNQGIVPPGFDFSEMKRDLATWNTLRPACCACASCWRRSKTPRWPSAATSSPPPWRATR
jgi:hypothetical protein